jgi:putative transcriptional regulator
VGDARGGARSLPIRLVVELSCAHTGSLLVASPTLSDPNFERGVILLLDKGEEGALGIMLNRPTGVAVEEILEPWQEQASLAPPGVVFAGGPVSRDAVIGIARSAKSGPGDLSSGDGDFVHWRPVTGELSTIDLAVPPELHPFPLTGARLFSGYAGWSTGQLEDEIEDGAWFVLDPLEDELLCEEPDRLWHDVLRRQGGSLSLLAAFPPHPSVN